MEKALYMVVDDSSIDRLVHQKLLQLADLAKDVLLFDRAMDAVDYLKLNAEDAEALPDFILLDIMMPNITGFDFLVYYESLVESLVKQPQIFMLSSSEDEGDLQKAGKNPNVKALLKKPFSPKALLKHLDDLKL